MSKVDGPKLVVALFTFKGKNNDEVCQILSTGLAMLLINLTSFYLR